MKEREDDPLQIPEGVRETIGSSYTSEDRPIGERSRSGLFPLAYRERVKNELTTTIFPVYYDRRTLDVDGSIAERQSLYGLYYRERSAKHEVDTAFPVYWHWRDDETRTTVIPPFLWRTAPKGEWHGWLAPLVFASSQPDGGYFHAPPLLTFSHHNPKRAFSLFGGIGFYDRTKLDVDWGVVPFVFGGNNADKLTSYFLIPPLLTYHSEDRDFETQTTLVGPVFSRTTPTSRVLDVFPLFLHNKGEDYHATTLLPLFHTSRNKDKRLLVTPLFLTASDNEGTTLVTPLYSQYRGRTRLDLAGPIVPLFAHYSDPDIYRDAWLLGPVYWAHDPTGYTILTPLFGQFREYGVSRTTWVLPTFQLSTAVDGWAFNIHPLLYLGRDADSSHSVVAPLWWDFASPKRRTTIAFPVFWRFRDEDGSTQVFLNTLYTEKASKRGTAWDFHFLPLVHVGESPDGGAFDFLFGFVGYKRQGTYKQLKLLWIPIDLTKNPDAAAAAPPRSSPVEPVER